MDMLEAAVIRELYATGKYTYRQIADQFDCSVYMVKKAIYGAKSKAQWKKHVPKNTVQELLYDFHIANCVCRIKA